MILRDSNAVPIPAVCVLRLAKTRIEERLRPRQVLRFMRGFRRTIFPLAAGLVFASPGEDLRLPFFRGVTARDPRPSAGRGVAVPARVCGAFGWSWRLDSGGCFFFAAFGVGCYGVRNPGLPDLHSPRLTLVPTQQRISSRGPFRPTPDGQTIL